MLCCRKVEDTQKDARKVAKVNSFPFLPLPLKKESWKRQPTPVFLPGKSHGRRSLAGYGPWGCKESDMTEHECANIHTHTHIITCIIIMVSHRVVSLL